MGRGGKGEMGAEEVCPMLSPPPSCPLPSQFFLPLVPLFHRLPEQVSSHKGRSPLWWGCRGSAQHARPGTCLLVTAATTTAAAHLASHRLRPCTLLYPV